MFFSTSALVKSSAVQLMYLRDKPRPAPTAAMLEGDLFAAKHTESHLVEMQGCLVTSANDTPIELFFTVDEIRNNYRNKVLMVEHKSVREVGVTDDNRWYFRSALIQTAFLGALVQMSPTLRTAKYRAQENEYHIDVSGKKVDAVLNFGGQYYSVKYSGEEILEFFLAKAHASLSYLTAREFDFKYKHKEWDEYFHTLIKYRKSNLK